LFCEFSSRFDEFFKIALIAVFKEEVDIVGCFREVYEFDDIGVVE
jgi:hypothetical protein